MDGHPLYYRPDDGEGILPVVFEKTDAGLYTWKQAKQLWKEKAMEKKAMEKKAKEEKAKEEKAKEERAKEKKASEKNSGG